FQASRNNAVKEEKSGSHHSRHHERATLC
ncbi:hypothetical protein QQF64_007927, partial [Cirrhinus molitorella]